MDATLCNESDVSVFYRLPIEVISHIMKFLPYADLKDARLVCKLWYDASQDPRLLAREVTICDSKNFDMVFTTHSKGNRRFPHLKFQMISVQEKNVWDNTHFWTQLGAHILSLEFWRCTIGYESFLRLLSCCTILRGLVIRECSLGVIRTTPPFYGNCQFILSTPPQLPRLRTLHLIQCTLQPVFFVMLLAEATDLRALHFKDSMLVDFANVDTSPTVQTCQTLLSFMRRNSNRVVQLSFVTRLAVIEGEGLEAFLRLVELQNVDLIALLVPNNPLVVFHMARLGLQKGLKSLSIDQFGHGRDLMECICHHFQNLTSLSMPATLFFSIRRFGLAATLSMNLVTLVLTDCSRFRDSDVWPLSCAQVTLRLKCLVLRYAFRVTPTCIAALARALPALTHLSLDMCGGVNDWSIQAIFCHQVALRSLSFNGCCVTDVGLLGINYEPRVALPWSGEPNPTGYSILRLTELRSLSIVDCRITDVSLERAIKLPSLRCLHLSSLKRLSTRGFQSLFRNNRSITRLALPHSPGLTDQDIEVMMTELQRLCYVNISFCPGISEETVSRLRKHCKFTVNRKAAESHAGEQQHLVFIFAAPLP